MSDVNTNVVDVFSTRWGVGDAAVVQFEDQWEAYELPIGSWSRAEVLSMIESDSLKFLSWGNGDYLDSLV